MLKEILESLNEKVIPSFDNLIDEIQKELKIEVTYKFDSGDFEYKYNGKIYSLIYERPIFKILDEEGVKLIQSKCMDKHGWFDIDCIINLIKNADEIN